MNKIFKTILAILLVIGLGAAVWLVQKNQETRRGATVAESSAQILPDKVGASVGQNFTVQLWVNTGKNTDMLAGANASVYYNDDVLQFVNFVPSNIGYTLLNPQVNKTSGIVDVKMVALGAEKGGAVNLGRITFRPKINGKVNIRVRAVSSIMVTGQSAEWKIATLRDSVVTIGNPANVPTCDPWESIQINGCSQTEWTSNPRNNACKVSTPTVPLRLNSPGATTMSFANVSESTNCGAVPDANFGGTRAYSATTNWSLAGGIGVKKVCVRVTNASGSAKCGALVQLVGDDPRPTATPTGTAQRVVTAGIFPPTVASSVGGTFTVTVRLNSNGPDSERLTKANIVVNYNSTNLTYIGHTPLTGYSLSNPNNVEATKGRLVFNAVSGATKSAFPANIMRITFRAIHTGSAVMSVGPASNVFLNAETTARTVSVVNRSMATIGGVNPTPTATGAPVCNLNCATGKVCKIVNNQPACVDKVVTAATFPATVASNVGGTFVVTVRLNSNGPASERVTKANVIVNYNEAKFRYIGHTPLTGYALTNPNNVEATKGRLVFNIVSGATKSAFPANIMRITFRSIANGSGVATVGPASNVFLNAETTAKTASVVNRTVVTIGGANPTPTDGAGPTPTPTDQPSGDASVLNYKVAFANVNPNSAQCLVDWPLKITVMGAGQTKTFADIVPSSRETVGTKLVFSGSLTLEGFNKRNGIAAFISGPKQLQTKYGIDGQSTVYGKAGGELTLSTGQTPVYDFSGYPMLAGDVVANDSQDRQDGSINGVDFAYIKSRSLVHETVDQGGYLRGDLDGNCQVNSNDVNILKISLQEKQGELY